MAFLDKPRDFPSLKFCGTYLHWVDKIKHLGNKISSTLDGGQLDMMVKTAKFVDKHNSICQEFYFAHPIRKIILDNIYNGHYSGSKLWQMQSQKYEKVMSTYKIMLDLPWATNRCLIEPLTDTQHLSKVLVKRYCSAWSRAEH